MVTFIPDVNYHLTNKCNMNCVFCFQKNTGVEDLTQKDMIKIVQMVADFGFKKINFVGGEPTICPWLGLLIEEAKSLGMTTSIVTNGSLLNDSWLNSISKNLDWIGISIDSLNQYTNKILGRKTSGCKAPDLDCYLELCQKIKSRNIKLKINTVVNSRNIEEDFQVLISQVRPDKWKIFQMLIIKGENDEADHLSVSKYEYEKFIEKHIDLSVFTNIYPETSQDMLGSYVMIDPSGCLIDNSKGSYRKSESVLSIGIKEALNQINLDFEKFRKRQSPVNNELMVTRVIDNVGGEIIR